MVLVVMVKVTEVELIDWLGRMIVIVEVVVMVKVLLVVVDLLIVMR